MFKLNTRVPKTLEVLQKLLEDSISKSFGKEMRAEHYHESNLAIRNKNEEFVIATWERLLVALHIGL